MPSLRFLKSIPFNIIFALVTIAMSVDIYVPNLPQIALDLNTSKSMVQFSVSIAVLSSSIVTFVIGPLSDALGRRHFMIVGQITYALAAWGATFVTTIQELLVLRCIQGGAGSIAFALTFAVISDLFHKTQAHKYYAYTTTALTMSLVAAPILGGIFGQFLTWRACFAWLGLMATLSSICLYFNVPETLVQKKPYNFKESLKSYGVLLSDKRFLGLATVPSVLLSFKISFFSVAAFYFIKVMGESTGTYGMYQGFIMLINCASSLLTVKAINLFGRSRALAIGMALIAGGTCFLVAACLILPSPRLSIVAAIACYAAGLGFSWALFLGDTMELYPQQAGLTSALLSIIRGGFIAIIVTGMSLIYEHSFLPVSLAAMGGITTCLIVYYLLYRVPSTAKLNP